MKKRSKLKNVTNKILAVVGGGIVGSICAAIAVHPAGELTYEVGGRAIEMFRDCHSVFDYIRYAHFAPIMTIAMGFGILCCGALSAGLAYGAYKNISK